MYQPVSVGPFHNLEEVVEETTPPTDPTPTDKIHPDPSEYPARWRTWCDGDDEEEEEVESVESETVDEVDREEKARQIKLLQLHLQRFVVDNSKKREPIKKNGLEKIVW